MPVTKEQARGGTNLGPGSSGPEFVARLSEINHHGDHGHSCLIPDFTGNIPHVSLLADLFDIGDV